MNTEQTKTLGQIAYKRLQQTFPATLSIPWGSLSDDGQESWNLAAQAVADEVLKRLPGEWVLLACGVRTVEWDECWSWELRCWMAAATGIAVDEGDIIRRRISPVPSKQPVQVTPPQEPTWTLPPPPAGHQWHRADGWTKEMLPEGYRPVLFGNSDHGDYETSCDGKTWADGEFPNYYAGARGGWMRTNRPLPQSAEPVAEEKPTTAMLESAVDHLSTRCGFPVVLDRIQVLWTIGNRVEKQDRMLDDLRNREVALTSERDQLRKELEASQGDLRIMKSHWDTAEDEIKRLTTENAALKETYKAGEALWQRELQGMRDGSTIQQREADWIRAEQENAEIEKELTRLRSQFRWTPISERMPTEKDAIDGMLWMRTYISGDVRHRHWTDASSFDLWMTPILPPLPSPETEEQAMRREFEAWALSGHANEFDLRKDSTGGYALSDTAIAWLAYQAALNSQKTSK